MAIDTSVIIEFIDRQGEHHDRAGDLFSSLISGELGATVPHPVLAEVYYVSSRIYGNLGLKDPSGRSEKLVTWLCGLPAVTVLGNGADLATRAGEAKLNLGLALTDCYVLAASKVRKCEALFKRRENEMLEKMEALEDEYQVGFLEDRTN